MRQQILGKKILRRACGDTGKLKQIEDRPGSQSHTLPPVTYFLQPALPSHPCPPCINNVVRSQIVRGLVCRCGQGPQDPVSFPKLAAKPLTRLGGTFPDQITAGANNRKRTSPQNQKWPASREARTPAQLAINCLRPFFPPS